MLDFPDKPGQRAKSLVRVDGRQYRGGEFLPFYVPRDEMPQVDEKYLPVLVSDALAAEVDPAFEVALVSNLRPHQRVDRGRVMRMPDELLYKPLLVSRDGFVLDGNHRWTKHVVTQQMMSPVIVLGALDFNEAIDWLNGRPYVYRIRPGTPERS